MGKKCRDTIAVSGGFDPVHVGHVRMIIDASKHGDVIVILNSDTWLRNKKGYVFMPWNERAEILESIKGVVKVIPVDDGDRTVCDALNSLKESVDLTYFANGGDRINTNTPEISICNKLGIELLWNIGGKKIQSSSSLVNDHKGMKHSTEGNRS
ncbi:cytidyltransferase [Candidatus Pacearchaeota archaeon]|nr:cytidyltransferase [Candidatus Pacearchaeota archaeon]|tara:strand:+ start:329 stop:790 length:462 start_codon:yes stop_codon:yes gene_type:complete